MTRAFAFVCALASCCSALAAQPQPAPAASPLGGAPLGRLFFTPEERAQLDIARTKKAAPAQTAAREHVEPPPPLPQIVTYGGIVRRSDGKSMLWINNRLVDEKEALAGLNLKGRVRADGAVTLQVPESGGSVDVKVGQSVELQTGRVAEGRRAQPESKPRAEEAPEAKSESKDSKAATAPLAAPDGAKK